MAKFEFAGLDMMVEELERIGKIDKLAPKMIEAATPILVENLKNNVRTAAGNGYATGELVASIGATDTEKNSYGYFSAVRPVGKDSKGMRNGEKMAYLEYGTSRNGKQHQPPRPVLTRTLHESEDAVLKRMQEVFDAEVGK